MKKNNRYIDVLIVVLLLAGIGFAITSLFMPPMGVIAPSVILFVGILFVMVAIMLAIQTKYRFHIQWGEHRYIDWRPDENSKD